jgi:hypothetical protein
MSKNREKRFVLKTEDQLKGLWSSKEGEPLTLTYTYSEATAADEVYREMIEIAVENINRWGFLRLQYKKMEMAPHLKVCPLESADIKARYENPIIFKKTSGVNRLDTAICRTKNNEIFYDTHLGPFLRDIEKGDSVKLPYFSEIICNTEHPLFLHIAIGVIMHEWMHVLGIGHSHVLEDTDGILTINIPKPELNAIKRGEIEKFFNIFAYGDFLQAVKYSPVSPFSIQHYNVEVLAPYRTFNQTRINELLDSYKISSEMKADYFELLKKYSGRLKGMTYQDFAAIATAVYHIAPDSLVGRTLNFPNYSFIQGIYFPEVDKYKLVNLVNALSAAECFSYPILAQKNVTIQVQTSKYFVINLYKYLKIFNLSNNVRCTLQRDNATFLSENVTLRSDCFMQGKLEVSDTFQFSVLLSNGLISTASSIILIAEANKKLKNRVLLARNQLTYAISESDYLDLIDVCQAVALPIENDLRCQFADSRLADTMRLEDCWFLFQAEKGDQNITFIFSNEEANRTCAIQFLVNQTLNDLESENLLFHRSDEVLSHVNELGAGYYAEGHHEYLVHSPGQAFLNQTAQNDSHSESFFRFGKQLIYGVTVPLLQGFFEGAIDGFFIDAYYLKCVLKVLPRTGLLYLDYFDFTRFALFCGVSFLEGALKHYLHGRINETLEKYIHRGLFLAITELEYGFSNLWALTDQVRFWPALTDKFNQLFLQWLFSPLIKTVGYGIGVNLIQYGSLAVSSSQAAQLKSEVPLLVSHETVSAESSVPVNASFFSAMRTASQSVFSRKTIQLFTLFSRTNPVRDKEKRAVLTNTEEKPSLETMI